MISSLPSLVYSPSPDAQTDRGPKGLRALDGTSVAGLDVDPIGVFVPRSMVLRKKGC